MRTHDHPTATGAPPRRRGHYSGDGAWWWDEDHGRWFRTTLPVDTLSVELEDHGQSTTMRSIMTTLTGQYGTQAYRFVGRARSEDPRWLRYTVTSDTFPLLPLQVGDLDHLGPRDAFAEEVMGAFRRFEDALGEQGWRLEETGEHWWSRTYTRPAVDWDTPAGEYDGDH